MSGGPESLRLVKNGVFAFRFDDPARSACVDPALVPVFQDLLQELNAGTSAEQTAPSVLELVVWSALFFPVAIALWLRGLLRARRAFARSAAAVNAACRLAERRLSPAYAFQRFGGDLFVYDARRCAWSLLLLREPQPPSFPATPVKSAKSYQPWSGGGSTFGSAPASAARPAAFE